MGIAVLGIDLLDAGAKPQGDGMERLEAHGAV
jgi:hypothetical protein